MKIVNSYDFNGGERAVLERYSKELSELEKAIENIKASDFLTKESKEKTTLGKIFYSPTELNKEFKRQLNPLGWESRKVICDYKYGKPRKNYILPSTKQSPYREMDFLKEDKKLGVEVQFGKYAFMVYNDDI